MTTALEHFQQQFLDDDVSYHETLQAFENVVPKTFHAFYSSDVHTFLCTIFSNEQQQLFDDILALITQLPYAQSYYRRSYRAPFAFDIHAARIFHVIDEIRKGNIGDVYDVFASDGHEQYVDGHMMYVDNEKQPIISTTLFPYVIALKLNAREEKLEHIIQEILWKNGAHRHYSRELVRGIFMSQHAYMHELVANVLLAAKNQEGVRQTITETIDEGTLTAQLSMMNIVLEHNLLRFSSVARAIDVWFGLGYDVTDERQLRYVLQTSYEALQQDDKIEALLNSSSSLDVFIGLWCLGSKNIEHALMCVDDLLEREPHIQQTTLYALRNMNLPQSYYEPFIPYILQTNDLHTFLYGFHIVIQQFPYAYYYEKADVAQDMQQFFFAHPWLAYRAEQWLMKVEQFMEGINESTITIEQKPFPFLSYTFHTLELFKLQILLAAYLKDEEQLLHIASTLKNKPVEYREYFYTFIPPYLHRYDLLLPALKDRGTGVRLQAMRKLKEVAYPLEQFAHIVPSLLTLKSGELRMAVIELLQAQPPEKIEALVAELLTHKKEQVRVGAIELLVQIKDDLTCDWTSVIAEPTVNEAKLLKQLAHEEETFLTTPPGTIAYVLPLQEQLPFTFRDFVAYDFEQLNVKLQPLRARLAEHATHSYDAKTYYGEYYTTVIGERLYADINKGDMTDSIDQLPLAELWVEAVVQSELTALDICCYLYAKKVAGSYFRSTLTKAGTAFLNSYVPPNKAAIFSRFSDELYEEQLQTIIEYTVRAGTAPLQQQLHAHAIAIGLDYVQFCSSMLLHFAKQELPHKLAESAMTYRDRYYEHYDIYFFAAAFHEMSTYAVSRQHVQQLLHTLTQFYDKLDDLLPYVNFSNLMTAFEADILSEHFLRHTFISSDFRYVLSLNNDVRAIINRSSKREELLSLVASLKQFIVEQELNRGDIETAVTGAVSYIDQIEGISYFIRILKALDGEKLSRQWMYRVQSRKDSLSTLLVKVTISDEQSDEEVFEQLREAAFSHERLIEAMLYNSKLIPLLSRFIGWHGLQEAAWYFIAHTSESTTDYEAAKIMEYSEIAPQDFERGAFDRQWFLRATSQLTREQFKAVYAAAKYATSGSNHRRAQLYAQATLGELQADELKAEIALKRNKDKLRAYSLIPATLQEAKERYVFFQAFLKESRQFGAQRRASEAEAVDMAIQNLAQQVSSGNTTQFIWLMEQQRFDELAKYFSPVQLEDVTLQLVQHEGAVTLTVRKGDKQLKAVPKKIAKHETVVAMNDAKKELTEQARRIKKQLEQAMCEEIPFNSAIIRTLSNIDAFAVVLEKLVFYASEQLYYVKDGQFYTVDGEVQSVDGELYVAHPVHLLASRQWRTWQHFVFHEKWQQPFKQVFRELYVVTDEERSSVRTNRLEGYQVQPTKAIALLKARGWKAGYYEPVRKISYRYNYMTHIDFVYDGYTPADVEAPTLADIYFEHRLTGEKQKLGDVPAVHFSEIMRDVDLVVSVAHAGEVDPEASHSTIDMRAAIVEEMVQLFNLSNVEVKLPHIVIRGELADYTIHLGSGNVHQLGGAMIPVIAVPSQHRGRVFLPFIDEDPKTAEISAKLLLFADDAAINDPQIRKAIQTP